MTTIADLLGDEHQKLLRPSGGCHNCPRRRVNYVPPTLNEGRVIVVGESPGPNDVKEQEGLVEAWGQFLRGALQDVGITEYSFTNVVHCRPPEGTKPGAKEIECCLSQFVLDEIRGYALVVLLGNTPLNTLFPGAGAKPWNFRGNVAWHPDFPEQRFYTIYHPAYVMRRREKEGAWRKHLERLGRIHAGEPKQEWELLSGGGERYWEALERALAAPLISLDVETNRLESWKVDSRLRSLALTADGKEVLFVHEKEAHFIGTVERIAKFLQDPSKHVVGHNTGFDLDWLEEAGDFQIRTTAIHDTATIAYEARQYEMPSLKELVAEELDGYRYLVYEPHKERNPDLLGKYNAEDVIYPLQLFRKGMREVKPRTRELLTRVSGPSGYILRKISNHGFWLRQDYWRAKTAEYEERKKATLQAWKDEDPDFIPTVHNTGKGLHEYLFRIKGLPVHRRTKKQAPSTGESALKGWIREGHTYLRHLLTLREVEKIKSTYLDAYEKHLQEDGRIHAGYTNTVTDTGRSSSRSPNLQNIPRNKEIRDLFGVPPGHVLMESDFSQAEFRIMVALARDANGIAAYQRGEDAHTATARSFSAGPDPTKEERSWAKVINFALLYGGDAYKVQQWARDQYDLDWSIEEAEDFVAAFWKTYPALPEFHRESAQKLTQNRGWFESITGHIFHYEDWDHPDQGRRDHVYRSALNSEAQGPAAQLCFLTMIHAHRLFGERQLPVKIVNTVHDSLLTDIGGEKYIGPTVAAIEEAKDIAYEWVRRWLVVPLVMDHEVGPSWGSLEEWNP